MLIGSGEFDFIISYKDKQYTAVSRTLNLVIYGKTIKKLMANISKTLYQKKKFYSVCLNDDFFGDAKRVKKNFDSITII